MRVPCFGGNCPTPHTVPERPGFDELCEAVKSTNQSINQPASHEMGLQLVLNCVLQHVTELCAAASVTYLGNGTLSCAFRPVDLILPHCSVYFRV